MSSVSPSYLGSPENPGTAALVSYITVIGWLIAYFALYRSKPVPFSAFHLRQTLLLHCLTVLVNILTLVVAWYRLSQWIAIVPAAILVLLWLWGLMDVVKNGEHPVPLIGQWAQRLFRWI
jgi:uncharacterized membrane protein